MPCQSQSVESVSTGRSIGHESPGQSLDQSISMSVGAYVQRVTPARSHHRRKYILRPSVDLFYLSLFLSLFIFIPLSTHSSRVSQHPRLTESRQLVVVSCFRDRAPRGSTRRDPREREREICIHIYPRLDPHPPLDRGLRMRNAGRNPRRDSQQEN